MARESIDGQGISIEQNEQPNFPWHKVSNIRGLQNFYYGLAFSGN